MMKMTFWVMTPLVPALTSHDVDCIVNGTVTFFSSRQLKWGATWPIWSCEAIGISIIWNQLHCQWHSDPCYRGTLVLCGAVVYLTMVKHYKSRLTEVQLSQTLAAHAMNKERQVTSLFYVTVLVPHSESTWSTQMRVLVLCLQHITQKAPVHIQPLFYMTWVMTQALTSWEVCMHSVTSLTNLVEMELHIHWNWAVPRPLSTLSLLTTHL